MRENRETTMLVQAILVWLMLAFAGLTLWLFCAAVAYFTLPADTPPPFRLIGAPTAATVIVAAIFALAGRLRVRNG